MTFSTSRSDRQLYPPRLPWLVLALVLGIPATTAWADNHDESQRHVAQAEKAHQEGRYEEARTELEAAYALDPDPALLYAIGQVNAKLGNCQDASDSYRRFVATQKDPQVARLVDEAIAACRPRAAPAAQRASATTASPRPDLPAPAAQRPVRTAQVPGGPVVDAPPQRRGSASTPPARRSPAGDVRSHSPWYTDKLGDGLVLAGVVAGIVGLVEYRSAAADLDAAEDRTKASTLARYQELVDGAHGKRVVSIAFAGAGGALIAAGLVRYVLHDRGAELRGVGVAPTRDGGVVTYAGRF